MSAARHARGGEEGADDVGSAPGYSSVGELQHLHFLGTRASDLWNSPSRVLVPPRSPASSMAQIATRQGGGRGRSERGSPSYALPMSDTPALAGQVSSSSARSPALTRARGARRPSSASRAACADRHPRDDGARLARRGRSRGARTSRRRQADDRRLRRGPSPERALSRSACGCMLGRGLLRLWAAEAGDRPDRRTEPALYGSRTIRGLYPALREDRLRDLERWGLVRPVARGAPRALLLVCRSGGAAAGERRAPRGRLVPRRRPRAPRQPAGPALARLPVRPRATTRPARSCTAGRARAARPATGRPRRRPPRVERAGARRCPGQQVLRRRRGDGHRRRGPARGRDDRLPPRARARSDHDRGARQPRQHSLRARSDRRGRGALREGAGHRPRAASRRTSISATSATTPAGSSARRAATREALALDPSYADAHFYLAVTLEKLGRSGEAPPALAGVPEARAAGRVGRAGARVQRIECEARDCPSSGAVLVAREYGLPVRPAMVTRRGRAALRFTLKKAHSGHQASGHEAVAAGKGQDLGMRAMRGHARRRRVRAQRQVSNRACGPVMEGETRRRA